LVGMVDGKLCWTGPAMAEVFGADDGILKEWAAAGCPVLPGDWWPMAGVVAWRGMQLAGGAGDIISLRSFGKLVGVAHKNIVQAIDAGRLTATVETPLGRQLKRAEALAQWEAEHASGGAGGMTADGMPWAQYRVKQEALLAESRRKVIDLQAAELEARLHDAGDVEAVWTDVIIRAKTHLLGLPSRVAPIVAAIKNHDLGKIQSAVELLVREALTELSHYDKGDVKKRSSNRRQPTAGE
jgi:phage terminase Nu1 subunit (DNA packaging protein)